MGNRISKDDPLWRNTKARYGGKFMMWNACVAMKRESERLVEALQQAGIEVPTVKKGGNKSDLEEPEDDEGVLSGSVPV